MTHGEPQFARTPSTSVFGECNARLDTPMPGELLELIASLGHLEGKGAATWARERLEREALLERERLKHIIAKLGVDPKRMNLG